MVYDYLYMRAWAEIMEHSPQELEDDLAQARAEKAPDDALFQMRVPGHWHTTKILAPDLLAAIEKKVAKMKAITQVLR